MACAQISGKKIRHFRHQNKMNQPGLAKYLSKLTGEVIDSITVCRMEKFGARGACHPLRPSNAVNEIVCPCVTVEIPVIAQD
jgi:hypothetical protein